MDASYQGPERRRAPRLAISLDASLRERGRTPFAVRLVDISADGCRAETYCTVEPGADVWVKLPGLEPRYSRIIWSQGGFAGIAFEAPLHEAVLDLLASVDRVPSESELAELRSISRRCRTLAADEAGHHLLDLADACERSGASSRPPSTP